MTTSAYDAGGNQTATTDPLGHTATTLYDALGRADDEHRPPGQPHDDDLRRERQRLDGEGPSRPCDLLRLRCAEPADAGAGRLGRPDHDGL